MAQNKKVREIVALFENRVDFDRAVAALIRAGFERADLSVLSSHQSIDAAGRKGKPYDEALTGLLGELNYAFPLTTAGLIAIVGGPIAGPIAALVAAGVGGAAVKEYLDEVTSHPQTDEFARALEAGGVILWVCIGDDPAKEMKAQEALTLPEAATSTWRSGRRCRGSEGGFTSRPLMIG